MDTLTLRSTRTRWLIAAIFAVFVAGLLLAVPAPAQAAPADEAAATPNAVAEIPFPAPEPFNAPLCAGETPEDPTNAQAAVSDLTRVWGARLENYNAGNPVILYGPSGQNGGTPNCAVRYIEDKGAVSEWIYCTDHQSKQCSVTNEDGELTEGGQVVGGLAGVGANDRLTTQQQTVITHIIQHDLVTTAFPDYDGLAASGSTLTADDTYQHRAAKQFLVWCVSDRGDFDKRIPNTDLGNYRIGQWCDTNMGADRQAQIAAAAAQNPQLSLTSEADSVEVGQTAHFTLTTNLYDQPINLTATGGDLRLCEQTDGGPTLTDGVLRVPSTDAEETTVALCATAETAGEVSVSARGEPTSTSHVTWAQSPGTDSITCQVYATLTGRTVPGVTAAAAIAFTPKAPTTGGFSIAKQVTGDGATQVPAGTEFTIRYAVDGDNPQTLQVTVGGDPTVVEGLPDGATVTLSEVDLPQLDQVTWADPSFTVDGEPVPTPATLTIGAGHVTEVTITNTAEPVVPETPTEEPTQPTPEAPTEQPTPDQDQGTTDSADRLPDTGAAGIWPIVGVAVVLLIIGGIALVVRRRGSKG